MQVTEIVDIMKGVGISGAILLLAYLWFPRIGAEISGGFNWFGTNFMLPIRDSLISNIGIWTGLVTELRAQVPVLKDGQQRVHEAVHEMKEKIESGSREEQKTRTLVKSLWQIAQGKCPEESTACPFKLKVNRNYMDSDDFSENKAQSPSSESK